MARKTIQSGRPPILWSSVDEAFKDVNANFLELYATILGASGEVVDFTSMVSNVVPRTTDTYDLGSPSRKWRDLYLSGDSLYLGDAVVTSTGTSVNLPAGSTVGGSLIKDPIEGSFKTIAVTGQPSVSAEDGTDTLNLVGASIDISLDPTTDTVTFTNAGVRAVGGGNGIAVSASTGSVTISNTGVRNLAVGAGISASTPTGEVILANTGVIKLIGGDGIGLDPAIGTGTITITNTARFTPQDIFRSIQVPGQLPLVADSPIDILTFLNGTGIQIVSNSESDAITFNNTGVINLSGSTGISVSSATGTVTLSNTGVTSLIPGSGISLSSSTGAITVANTRPGFTSIAVAGQSPLLADNETDTATLVAGTNITLTTDAATDSITISLNRRVDIIGSVFGDDSSLLVDGTGGRIIGPVETPRLRTSETEIRLGAIPDFASPVGGPAAYTVAVGAFAGEIRQNTNAIAIGYIAANEDQGDHAIAVGVNSGGQRQGSYGAAFGVEAAYRDQGVRALALGYQAGAFSQGVESVAIGKGAGHTNQHANSLILNASGTNLNSDGANRFYVDPIRSATTTGNILQYNTTTKEIIYSNTINANTVGYHTGDVKGSIVGDDSTILIDGTNSRVVGRILSPQITGVQQFTTTPTLKTFNLDNVPDQMFRLVSNMSTYGSTITPRIELASYRAAPASGDAGPGILFRASTQSVNDDVVGSIDTSITDYASGSVDSVIRFNVKQNNISTNSVNVLGSGLQVNGSVSASTFFQLPVFTNDSARNTAIPFPAAGQVVFNQTGNFFQGYNGTAWVNLN
jgi:hypothetical protein